MYCFARDYGCVHPGMPLGRKHPRRSRDAPNVRISALDQPESSLQRTTSRLCSKHLEVNVLDESEVTVGAGNQCLNLGNGCFWLARLARGATLALGNSTKQLMTDN